MLCPHPGPSPGPSPLAETDRLLWFKKGEAYDCILGEMPISSQTEITKRVPPPPPAPTMAPPLAPAMAPPPASTMASPQDPPLAPGPAPGPASSPHLPPCPVPRCRYAANLVTPQKLTIKTGSKELDLMPIKLGDFDEWIEVTRGVVLVHDAMHGAVHGVMRGAMSGAVHGVVAGRLHSWLHLWLQVLEQLVAQLNAPASFSSLPLVDKVSSHSQYIVRTSYVQSTCRL